MRFVLVESFNVKEGRYGDLQDWLTENEDHIGDLVPDGVRLVGFFGMVFGTDRDGGQVRAMWELDSYAANDAFSEALRGELGELAAQLNEFTDNSSTAQGGRLLFRRLTDASVIG